MIGVFKQLFCQPDPAKVVSYDPVIRQLDDPDQIILPLEYRGQITYKPKVEPGEHVRKGQMVAQSVNGSSILSSINGTVKEQGSVWTAEGIHSPALFISKDAPTDAEETSTVNGADTSEALMAQLKAAGVFPPLSFGTQEDETEKPPAITKIIITAISQETTQLTSQLLLEQQGEKVIKGLKLLARLLPDAKYYLTAPEEHRDLVEEQYSKLAELVFLPRNYSSRIEKEVVAQITGNRLVNPTDYISHGLLVLGLEYLLAMVDSVEKQVPFLQKHITISGTNIEQAITVRFPLGSTLGYILDSVGINMSEYTRPVIGGPMTGIAQYSDQTPITYFDGIHLIADDVTPFDNLAPCINCGRCTRACPVNLQVHLINRMVEFGQLESAKRLQPEACHQCGMCGYVCPAERPIVQLLYFCNNDTIQVERHSWTAGGTS